MVGDLTLFEALTGGAFYLLNWQHNGAFDQNFSKKSNAPGFARGVGWGGMGGFGIDRYKICPVLAEAEIAIDSVGHSSALWDEYDLRLSTGRLLSSFQAVKRVKSLVVSPETVLQTNLVTAAFFVVPKRSLTILLGNEPFLNNLTAYFKD